MSSRQGEIAHVIRLLSRLRRRLPESARAAATLLICSLENYGRDPLPIFRDFLLEDLDRVAAVLRPQRRCAESFRLPLMHPHPADNSKRYG